MSLFKKRSPELFVSLISLEVRSSYQSYKSITNQIKSINDSADHRTLSHTTYIYIYIFIRLWVYRLNHLLHIIIFLCKRQKTHQTANLFVVFAHANWLRNWTGLINESERESNDMFRMRCTMLSTRKLKRARWFTECRHFVWISLAAHNLFFNWSGVGERIFVCYFTKEFYFFFRVL